VIDSGNTLIIDPGVEVVFTGLYKLIVNGTLTAVGTPDHYITFRANDTTGWHDDSISAGGWRGMYFSPEGSLAQPGGNFSLPSSLTYCEIKDTKNGTLMPMDYNHTILTTKPLKIKHCDLHHNINLTGSETIVYIANIDTGYNDGIFEMDSCRIYDNIVHDETYLGFGVISVETFPNPIERLEIVIRNCEFYDNVVGWHGVASCMLSNMQFENNEVHDNLGFGVRSQQSFFSVIRNNKIYNNFYGYLRNQSAVTLEGVKYGYVDNNIICNNAASDTMIAFCPEYGAGGAINLNSTEYYMVPDPLYLVRNNVIANNFSNLGGAICILGGKSLILNNTIVRNRTDMDGKSIAIYWGPAVVDVQNNIFYGNENRSIMGGHNPARHRDGFLACS
jgi:hypothetical protein